MASIRKRCKRRVAWVGFHRALSVTLDSYPGGSEVKTVLRFKKRPWPRYRPSPYTPTLKDYLSMKTWAELFPSTPCTVKVLPDYVVECEPDDPARLLSETLIREADWIIGVDPGFMDDSAVACRIVKGRDPKDGVIRYQLTEFIDFGNKAIKLHGSAKSTT